VKHVSTMVIGAHSRAVTYAQAAIALGVTALVVHHGTGISSSPAFPGIAEMSSIPKIAIPGCRPSALSV
jgi:hypothetical protein